MANQMSLLFSALFLVVSYFTTVVHGGCCDTNLNYCGGFLSRYKCVHLDLNEESLYSCHNGEDPVEIRECSLGCNLQPGGENDICHTPRTQPTTTASPRTTTTEENRFFILDSGESLRVGESLWSANKKAKLIMQSDGNAVVYRVSDNKGLWSSNTQQLTDNKKPTAMKIREDGNIVMLNARKETVWTVYWKPQVGGEKFEGVKLRLENDGSLCLFKTFVCLWKSGEIARR